MTDSSKFIALSNRAVFWRVLRLFCLIQLFAVLVFVLINSFHVPPGYLLVTFFSIFYQFGLLFCVLPTIIFGIPYALSVMVQYDENRSSRSGLSVKGYRVIMGLVFIGILMVSYFLSIKFSYSDGWPMIFGFAICGLILFSLFVCQIFITWVWGFRSSNNLEQPSVLSVNPETVHLPIVPADSKLLQRMGTNLPRPEPVSTIRKFAVLLTFVICTIVVLNLWLKMQGCCHTENDAWGQLFVLFWGITGSLIVWLLVVIRARTFKGMLVVSITLIAILTTCTIGFTGSKILYRNYIEQRYDREVAKVRSYTTMEQCGKIVNNKTIVYPPEYLIRNFSSYYYWRTCIYGAFQSEADYPTCLQQAGEKVDYYGPPLKEECEKARLAVTANSVLGCDVLQPKGNMETEMHPNAYDLCYTRITGTVAPSGVQHDQNVTDEQPVSDANTAPPNSTNTAITTFQSCSQASSTIWPTCTNQEPLWHPQGAPFSSENIEEKLQTCLAVSADGNQEVARFHGYCVVGYAAWSAGYGRPEVCDTLRGYFTGEDLLWAEKICYKALCRAPKDQNASCLAYYAQNPTNSP